MEAALETPFETIAQISERLRVGKTTAVTLKMLMREQIGCLAL